MILSSKGRKNILMCLAMSNFKSILIYANMGNLVLLLILFTGCALDVSVEQCVQNDLYGWLV